MMKSSLTASLIIFCCFFGISVNSQSISTFNEAEFLTEQSEYLFGSNYKKEETSSILNDHLLVVDSGFLVNQSSLIYDPVRDPKRLGYNTGVFVGAALVSFGVLWVLPESITNWDKDEIKEEGLFNKWKENVKAGPVWDEDDWFLNYVTHPYAGAVYYMAARGSGFKKWESFTYSFIMSTFFWEYGVEAFAEIPSWQDIIITPTVGSVIGECFFKWKGNIVRNGGTTLNSKFLGKTTMFLMDPFNEFLDFVGYETQHNVQSTSFIGPISYDFQARKQVWGLNVSMSF